MFDSVRKKYFALLLLGAFAAAIAIVVFRPTHARAQSPSQVLYGIDFSPYLTGQDPNLNSQITPAQITNRLQLVAPYIRWVRTFSSTNGFENIPSLARQFGLKVAANAWISSNSAQNAIEIQNLIAAANAGRIDIAIVGSEALLRNDVSETQLIGYMNQVRQAIPNTIPVTTADTYGTLLAHPNVIAAATGVLFANFYPYWEGVSINNAVCSLAQKYQSLSAAAGGKQVVISETGWPSDGNAVGAAVPSLSNATQFFLQFVTWATANNIPYFYFEAFDENWKVAYEGPQGAHWGVWDANGNLKPGMGAVLSGTTSPVTCDGTIGGPGTPTISFTYVPPYGGSDVLEGQVQHVDPVSYGVAVYIKVSGGWWTKPTFNQPITRIGPDGTWSAPVVTGGSDTLATDIAAFLIPLSFSPPLLSGSGTLPDTLPANSVASLQVHRTQNSLSGIITDTLNHPVSGVMISAGALGIALSAPDGRYSFFNIPVSGTATLTPSHANFVFTPSSVTLNLTSSNQIANFTATPTVDLSLTSTLSANSIRVGSPLTATFVVANAGIIAATGAVATISIPSLMNIVSTATTRGACNTVGQQVTCNVGALTPTAYATITVNAIATNVGSFSVSASVTGPDLDSNTANNGTSQPLLVSSGALTDLAVYRNGLWFVDWNGNRVWDAVDAAHVSGFGLPGDLPVVGDWNGDGRMKFGVYRKGLWFVDYAGKNGFDPATYQVYAFGLPGDLPVLGDWNGDGRMKLGVYRNGLWFVDYAGKNGFDPATYRVYSFGLPGDLPVLGDWNGDGRMKLGVYRNGLWFVDYAGKNGFDPATYQVYAFGLPGDLPVLGDWNGDGRMKLGVYRNGLWFVDYAGKNGFDPATYQVYAFGLPGDLPIVGRWDPSRQSAVTASAFEPKNENAPGLYDVTALHGISDLLERNPGLRSVAEKMRREQSYIENSPELKQKLSDMKREVDEITSSPEVQMKLTNMRQEMERVRQKFEREHDRK